MSQLSTPLSRFQPCLRVSTDGNYSVSVQDDLEITNKIDNLLRTSNRIFALFFSAFSRENLVQQVYILMAAVDRSRMVYYRFSVYEKYLM